jgi:hypothetical protein
MWNNVKPIFVLIAILLLAGLACGPGVPDVTVPDGAIQTVQAAGQQAGSVAETAVALATTEGSSAVATLQAGGAEVDLGPLQDKFESIEPDENGNFSVTITDTELNQALQQAQEAQAAGNSPLQQPVIVFTGGNVALTANVTQPVEAQLTVAFRPVVEDGVLQFEVVSATLGALQVPTAVLSSAESTLNSTLGQAMNSLPTDVTLLSIEMGEGTMTISGRRN